MFLIRGFIFDVETITVLTFFTIGLSYVLTGSKVGYPVRFMVCLLLKVVRLTFLWPLVQCPPCFGWWAGLGVGLITGFEIGGAVQLAFTACGVLGIIQAALGGDGIAAGEDFESIFAELLGEKNG
jgi:hypothetical protein